MSSLQCWSAHGQTRRDFLLGTAAICVSGIVTPALAGCGESKSQPASKELRTIKVQPSWILDAALGGLYVAVDKGYYRDVGLSVQLVPGGPGVDPVIPVVSGEALVGIHTNASSVMIPASRGVPLKAIASQYKKSPLGLMAKATSGVKNVGDFRGKKIGVVQTSVSVLEAILKHNGLYGSAQPVVLDASAFLPALLSNQVDALVAFEINQGVDLDLRGVQYVFFYFNDLGYPQESYAYFTSERSLRDNHADLAGFMAATKRGWDYAVAHPDEVASLTATKFSPGGNQQLQSRLAGKQIPLMRSSVTQAHGLLYMDRDTWRATNGVLAEAGLVQQSVNLDKLMTWELLK
jgi:NitT/TauT family transport system substrate-binding protein